MQEVQFQDVFSQIMFFDVTDLNCYTFASGWTRTLILVSNDR